MYPLHPTFMKSTYGASIGTKYYVKPSTYSISRMGVTILFVIEFNYSWLIPHGMLKKPVTFNDY